mmetsp:Transcript_40779/g.134979  ORF Transcript_40779/g.134979 Transcript_40779/m.134979 type:complete len:299 (+) Transcript_40779:3-899(+)
MFSGLRSQWITPSCRSRISACSSCFEKKRTSERERPRQPFCCSSCSRLTPSASKTRQTCSRCEKCSCSCTISERGSVPFACLPAASSGAPASGALAPPSVSRGAGGPLAESGRQRDWRMPTSVSACFRRADLLRITLSAKMSPETSERTLKTWPKVPLPRAERTSKPSPVSPFSITSDTDTTKSPSSLSCGLFEQRVEGLVRRRRFAGAPAVRRGSTSESVSASRTVSRCSIEDEPAAPGGGIGSAPGRATKTPKALGDPCPIGARAPVGGAEGIGASGVADGAFARQPESSEDTKTV